MQDNFGNFWIYGVSQHNYVLTDEILRPGDTPKFTVSAHDPSGEKLYYGFKLGLNGSEIWQTHPQIAIRITEAHIKTSIAVYIKVRNSRAYYANGSYDSIIEFRYTVSPL